MDPKFSGPHLAISSAATVPVATRLPPPSLMLTLWDNAKTRLGPSVLAWPYHLFKAPADCASPCIVEGDLLWASCHHHVVGSEVLWAGTAVRYIEPRRRWWSTSLSHPPLQQVSQAVRLTRLSKRDLFLNATDSTGKNRQTFVLFQVASLYRKPQKRLCLNS